MSRSKIKFFRFMQRSKKNTLISNLVYGVAASSLDVASQMFFDHYGFHHNDPNNDANIYAHINGMRSLNIEGANFTVPNI